MGSAWVPLVVEWPPRSLIRGLLWASLPRPDPPEARLGAERVLLAERCVLPSSIKDLSVRWGSGRLGGSTCVLRPALGGHRNHHHPDYWIFRLVGAAILLLRFSSSMETGLLSDTRGAVWVPSYLLVGFRYWRALLHSSRVRSASSVCKVSSPIPTPSMIISFFQTSKRQLHHGAIVWCRQPTLCYHSLTRSVTSREMSIAVESRDQGSCSVKFSRSMRFRLDLWPVDCGLYDFDDPIVPRNCLESRL